MIKPNNTATEHRKKYPIRCIECGKKEVRPAMVHQTVQRNHDGRIYDLDVTNLPVTRCEACGEVYFTLDSDDRIIAVLREQLGLLTPEQIRANLEALQLNQKEAAAALGVAAETLSRWLTGGLIQSRAMDNLLRAFFGSAEVQHGLMNPEGRCRFGEKIAPELLAQGTARFKNVCMSSALLVRLPIPQTNKFLNTAVGSRY